MFSGLTLYINGNKEKEGSKEKVVIFL